MVHLVRQITFIKLELFSWLFFPQTFSQEQLGIQTLTFSTPWFMTVFTSTLPWASVLRVWDVFSLLGSLSSLKFELNQPTFLNQTFFGSLFLLFKVDLFCIKLPWLSSPSIKVSFLHSFSERQLRPTFSVWTLETILKINDLNELLPFLLREIPPESLVPPPLFAAIEKLKIRTKDIHKLELQLAEKENLLHLVDYWLAPPLLSLSLSPFFFFLFFFEKNKRKMKRKITIAQIHQQHSQSYLQIYWIQRKYKKTGKKRKRKRKRKEEEKEKEKEKDQKCAKT